MKKLLVIVVLGLFLITPSWADNIRDLEIEGIVIGDNLLDHFSKQEIKKESLSSVTYDFLKDPDKFIQVEFINHSSLETYDSIQVFYKKYT